MIIYGKQFAADHKGIEQIMVNPLLERGRQMRAQLKEKTLVSGFNGGEIVVITTPENQWIGYKNEVPATLQSEYRRAIRNDPLYAGDFIYRAK